MRCTSLCTVYCRFLDEILGTKPPILETLQAVRIINIRAALIKALFKQHLMSIAHFFAARCMSLFVEQIVQFALTETVLWLTEFNAISVDFQILRSGCLISE